MNQGIERNIAIHIPSSYLPGSNIPLVVSLASRNTETALKLGNWDEKSENDVWVDETSPVKSFPTNAFGVYDMHG
ncbi:MAG: SUMF1/EgtB/PvdO family nonheme iron enzyme, partial [Gammaproteobacteria bacterium]|nr:SUMF1/EgtB/PvdO family nonheme iron enzyme [Gammaproteobacteria bacterium]